MKKIAFSVLFLFYAMILPQALPAFTPEDLTPDEQAWLKHHDRLTFSEVDWQPMSYVEDFPIFKGIIADYLNIISEKSGLSLQFIKGGTWQEVIDQFNRGDIDIIPALAKEDNIGSEVMLTDPYVTFPLVIATRPDVDFIGYTHELDGKKVGAGRGYTSFHFLKNNHPGIHLVQTDDVRQGLKLLAKGKIDAFVGHLAVVIYAMNAMDLDIKIAGRTEYDFQHRVGISPRHAEAVPIFNKIFAGISKEEHSRIYNKWFHMAERRTDYSLVWKILLGFAVISFLAGYRYIMLSRVNRKLERLANTDVLTQLANRKSLNEALEIAEYNWLRYETPFTLILLDIDDFKKVNDRFGHAVGDEVLKQFSGILKKQIRKSDMAGRWGGEEFMIICPSTKLDGARRLAEHLHGRINTRKFDIIDHATASFSIAQCSKKEPLRNLFQRLDKALYTAKKSGKNCIKQG